MFRFAARCSPAAFLVVLPGQSASITQAQPLGHLASVLLIACSVTAAGDPERTVQARCLTVRLKYLSRAIIQPAWTGLSQTCPTPKPNGYTCGLSGCPTPRRSAP